METVKDSAGNTTTNVYDVRGFKTDTFDPDMGHWCYDYDVLGELKTQTDAKGQVATFEYDKLGRMVKRFEPEGTTRRISTWVYDKAVMGIGQLASESSALETNPNNPNFKCTYTYDEFSRPETTTTIIDGTSYTTSQHYDAASRIDVITYPATSTSGKNPSASRCTMSITPQPISSTSRRPMIQVSSIGKPRVSTRTARWKQRCKTAAVMRALW